MRRWVGRIGGMLALLGVVSVIIQLFNLELRALRPLTEMAPAGAWAIRIGLILIGGLMAWWGFAPTPDEKAAEAENRKAAEAAGLDGATDPYVVEVRSDARFAELLAQVAQKHQLHDGATVEAERYRIRHAAFLDKNGLRVDIEAPNAAWVALYLERKNAPKRLQVSLSLENQELHENALSGMQWSALVP